MNWESFYLICFGVGLLLSVLSFAGGFGHLHLGHLPLGHHAHAGHAHGNGISPFNMLTTMAFLCWFGGAGYLLTHYNFAVVPVSWTNRQHGVSKLRVQEMGSRYAFIILYVWLEHHLSRGDYRRNDVPSSAQAETAAEQTQTA